MKINYKVSKRMFVLMTLLCLLLVDMVHVPPILFAEEQENFESEQKLYKEIEDSMLALGFIGTNEPIEKEIDVDEAIDEAKTYLKKYPEGENANKVQLYLAFIYEQKKQDYARAIEEFDKVIENYPEDEWYVSVAKSEKARLEGKLRRDFFEELEKVEFVIRPSQEKYKVGESLEGELMVINNSSIEFNIYHGTYYDSWEVEIRVYNDQGEWVSSEYFEYSPSLDKDEFLTLKPGESIKIDYKVDGYIKTDEVAEIEEDITIDKDSKIFPPGKYTIRAEFMLSAKEKYRESLIENYLPFGKWPSDSEVEVTVLQQLKKDIAPEETTKETEQITEENNVKPQSTIYLKNGQTTTGEITSENKNSIKINTGVIEFTINKEDIEKIER